MLQPHNSIALVDLVLGPADIRIPVLAQYSLLRLPRICVRILGVPLPAFSFALSGLVVVLLLTQGEGQNRPFALGCNLSPLRGCSASSAAAPGGSGYFCGISVWPRVQPSHGRVIFVTSRCHCKATQSHSPEGAKECSPG